MIKKCGKEERKKYKIKKIINNYFLIVSLRNLTAATTNTMRFENKPNSPPKRYLNLLITHVFPFVFKINNIISEK